MIYNISNRTEAPAIEQNNIVISSKIKTHKPKSNSKNIKNKNKSKPSEPIRDLSLIPLCEDFLFRSTNSMYTNARNVLIFVFGINVGLRISDLFSLKFKDVLNSDYTIVDELCVFESKTKKVNRPILNQKTKETIKDFISLIGKSNINMENYIFSANQNEFNTPLDTTVFYKEIKKMQKHFNISDSWGTHTLRKTFAYWTLKLGDNDKDTMTCLQEMLNHSSAKTTLHYSGITKERYQKMYSDIQNLFSKDFKFKNENANNNSNSNSDLTSKINMILELLNKEEAENI